MLRQLLESGSLLDVVAALIALGLIVSAILCLVYIIVGGISFILSAGNEEKIKKAVNTIRYAIIGLFVSFIAFFAVQFIARLLDIPFALSFQTVVDIMREIFASLQ